MKALLQVREPLYEKAADAIVHTSHLDHDEVADLILREIDKLKKG
jgi:shikimate kinase